MNERKNFAWPVTSINREDYDALEECLVKHREQLLKSKLMIFGAGIRGTEFCMLLEKKGFSISGFLDNNPEKWGGRIYNFPIYNPSRLNNDNESHKIIVSVEEGHEIERQLKEQGLIRDFDFFIIKSRLYDNYEEEFRRPYSNQILILADCEFSKISMQDIRTENIKEMLQEKLGAENIKILAMHGMGIRSYYNIMRSQLSLGMKPNLLFVMVNFDTLTGKQHLLPRSQHASLLKRLYEITPSKDSEWEEYLRLVNERTKNLCAEFSVSPGVNEALAIKNRNKIYMKINYMYTLDPEVEGLQYLIHMLQLARREKIKIIPFIPAVNYMLGEELWGEQFYINYNNNINLIKNMLSPYGTELFDMSYSLPKTCFADEDTPDETLNITGRRKVTEMFTEKIKGQL